MGLYRGTVPPLRQSVLGAPAARAAAIAAQYPTGAYPSPPVAFSELAVAGQCR
jgi:hypothetical protein